MQMHTTPLSGNMYRLTCQFQLMFKSSMEVEALLPVPVVAESVTILIQTVCPMLLSALPKFTDTGVAPKTFAVFSVAGFVVASVKLEGLSPIPYCTFQMVVLPMLLSRDWSRNPSCRLLFPIVLSILNKKDDPGS